MIFFRKLHRTDKLSVYGGFWLFVLALTVSQIFSGHIHAAPAGSEKAPAQIRIGYQKSAINLILLKQRGILETSFPETKISWVEFPAGPQLLEALSVGSLDFGLTGDAPPIFAQSAGKDIVYVGAEPPKPKSSAILVSADSTIKKLSDLKGKRIAFQKGSSSHNLVVRALKKAGLAWGDIDPAYLPPAEGRAAFEKGSVDAWAVWDPYYAAAELSSFKPRVLTNGEGLSDNNSFYLSSTTFSKNYPETIKKLLSQLTEADQYISANKKDSAIAYAYYSGLPLEVVYRFVDRRPVAPTTPLGAKTIAEQQRVADTFYQLGLIPNPIRVADAVAKPLEVGKVR
ncbi:MAG: sulfonate ABC transporter substrate-binding protein [Polynucleobacter sp.]